MIHESLPAISGPDTDQTVPVAELVDHYNEDADEVAAARKRLAHVLEAHPEREHDPAFVFALGRYVGNLDRLRTYRAFVVTRTIEDPLTLLEDSQLALFEMPDRKDQN
jgi:hypothetical protein